MTLKGFKSLATLFLTGDNVLPSDNEQIISGLEAALLEVASEANSLKLLTINNTENILRTGPGNYLYRIPRLPSDSTDDIDIDSELGPAVARLFASYISKTKEDLHRARAKDLINDYNSKVESYIQELEQDNKLPEPDPYYQLGLYNG